MNAVQLDDLRIMLPWSVPPDETTFERFHFVRQLDRVLTLAGKHILEPGCFEGYYSVLLAQRGARVTAFDVRPLNVVRAFARSLYAGVSLDLHVADAADTTRFLQAGDIDLVWHCGLLYHLTEPAAHLQMLHNCRWLFLDTHISNAEQVTNPRLGELAEHRGYQGRWYREIGWRDQLSGTGELSFWFTEQELLRAAADAGLELKQQIAGDDINPLGQRRAYLFHGSAA